MEENWNTFRNKLLELMNTHIPSALSRKHKELPWWNRFLQRLVRSKQRAYNKAKRTKKPTNWAKYRHIQKSIQREMRRARWTYINKILIQGLEEDNNKPFWKFVKSRKQDNIGVAPLKEEGKIFTESKAKAEILNRQFKSVFTQEGDGPLPDPLCQRFPEIGDITINSEGIQKLLQSIKPNKASGPDDIPCRLLKELAKEIAPILTIIFNQSLDTGVTPSDWNKANVAPIFKKGNTNSPANYRPVSLTCVCCKILEHIVVRHVILHYEQHNILTQHQHGFRAKHSCVSQLITTVHDLMTNHDKKVQTDVIVLDFSKAFDTVPHRRLLHKLDNYGIRGKTHKWIQAFLSDRSQRVVVDGAHSEWGSVDSGVPQGSVLGPLLFLTHINDLPRVVTSQCRLFADDCLLYRAIRTREDQIALQEDLNNLQVWANEWGMRFNASKCEVLRIRRGHPLECFYTIDGHVLSEVENAKYLGVYISNNLDWTAQIEATVSKANRTLGFLRRNLYGCPRELKETAYLSLVRSVLEYASQVWDPKKKKHKDPLEAVQKRAARFVTRDYSRSSITKMLENLKWESLETRRKHLRLVLLYQGINSKAAIPSAPLQTRDTGLSTRSAYKIIPAAYDPLKYSFFPRTITQWNSLPTAVTGSDTADNFRAKLSALKSRD